MAQSREAAPNDEGIGTRASDLGAWDKLQLGWLDYETGADPSQRPSHRPRSRTSTTPTRPQAAVVVLPKKQVTQTLAKPVRRHQGLVERHGRRLQRLHGAQRRRCRRAPPR